MESDCLIPYLREKKCFILDLDGVVYHGKSPIPGAVWAISIYKKLGKMVVFLTNNSFRSSAKIVQKLVDFGIECQPDDLMTSSQAAALMIKEKKLDDLGVFVIGSEELQQELIDGGISCVESDVCGAVLVGLDLNFSYRSITQGLRALSRGVPLIICNRDANFPGDNGQLMPGCGAMVGALEISSRRSADLEVGKPNTIMLDLLMQKLNLTTHDCIMVGDTLESDIVMANHANMVSILIGKSVEISENTLIKPTGILPSLEALANLMMKTGEIL